MAGEISSAEQNGNMSTPKEIKGLHTVEQHCQGLIAQLSQDKASEQVVKWSKDTLGKLMNSVKGFEQRLQQQIKEQAGQNGNGMTPESISKIVAAQVKAHVDAEIKSKKAAQQSVLKDRQHVKEERRKDAAAFAQIQRENLIARSSANNKRDSLSDE